MIFKIYEEQILKKIIGRFITLDKGIIIKKKWIKKKKKENEK